MPSILKVLRDAEDDEVVEVTVDLRLDVAAFRKAVAHGRTKNWTHERDGEWAELIFNAIVDGAEIEYDLDDAEVLQGPKGMLEHGGGET
jgi:hypothetical protein